MTTSLEYVLLILNNELIIQSRISLDDDLIKNINSIIYPSNTYPHNKDLGIYKNPTSLKDTTDISLTRIEENGFYAPYTNYYTIFSTTIISLLERLKIINIGDIIRIEYIYNTPQDALVYKYYNSLTDYKNYITESNYKLMNENIYFQSIKTQSHLLEAIYPISPILSLEESFHTYSYFDLMSWIQCNSEHSRHWIFRTPLLINSSYSSLFKFIKNTITQFNNKNSIIAFCDNSSAIQGMISPLLTFSNPQFISHLNSELNTYEIKSVLTHPTLTAETHNYPTYYHPFQGAATGVGGRIRDSLATGCGSISSASLMGYSINNSKLLVDASNGASDYANKIGEPCIGGFLRFHPMFEKPIMFSAGLGFIKDSHRYSPDCHTPSPGDLLIKIGPPAFKIGFGGSIMSSVDNTSTENDMTAIQRGDPYNGNKVARFLEILALLEKPIIKKIHDQGAGGLANVITELLDGWDASIDLSVLPSAEGMNSLECWISEYQEQMVFICSPNSIPLLEIIASREGVLLHTIGTILESKTSTIHFNLVSNKSYIFQYNKINDVINEKHSQAFYSSQLQNNITLYIFKQYLTFLKIITHITTITIITTITTITIITIITTIITIVVMNVMSRKWNGLLNVI